MELYKKKRGLVLVTGPTGSGKSTTLASIINKANENLTDHIITLEDPIEYVHHHKTAGSSGGHSTSINLPLIRSLGGIPTAICM